VIPGNYADAHARAQQTLAIAKSSVAMGISHQESAADAVGKHYAVDREQSYFLKLPSFATLFGSQPNLRNLCRRPNMHTFTSSDGTRIAYHDEGDGPAVILLHGFGVDGLGQFGEFERILPGLEKRQAMFRQAFGGAPPLPDPSPESRLGLARTLLAAGARAILPDMRGFGASAKPCERSAYEDSAHSRDVVALIDHLHLDVVDVIGYSMGCGTAARLMALHPPQVKSAILAGVGDYVLEDNVMEFLDYAQRVGGGGCPHSRTRRNHSRTPRLREPYGCARNRCRSQSPRRRNSRSGDADVAGGGAPYHRSTGPGPQRPGRRRQSKDRWPSRRDANRTRRDLRRRPPFHAVPADIPSSRDPVLPGTMATPSIATRQSATLRWLLGASGGSLALPAGCL
jgi:pimeloyl-ACP methyl ester carboxylesterase